MALTYLIWCNVALVGAYVSYTLLFRQLRWFHINRFWLLGMSVFAVLFPWISLPDEVATHTISPFVLEEWRVLPESLTEVSSSWTLWSIGGIVYISVTIILFARLLAAWLRVKQLLATGRHEKRGEAILVWHYENMPPFSVGQFIVLNQNLDPEALRVILAHERVHVRQRHTIDVVWIECLAILFWFNPVLVLYKRALREVHEFLADEAVLREGAPKHAYGQLIMSMAMGAYPTRLVHPFFTQSILTRRMHMISQNNQRPKKSQWRYLLILPLVLGLLTLKACSEQTAVTPQEDLSGTEARTGNSQSDEMAEESSAILPTFPGGQEELIRYLSEAITYPKDKDGDLVEGRVLVSFAIAQNGQVQDVRIKESLNESLDQVALNAVAQMPDWAPGTKDGAPVKMELTLPIRFAPN